jgi:hypothetical protein
MLTGAVPEPGAGSEFAVTIRPAGIPLATNVIGALKPPDNALVTDHVPLVPIPIPALPGGVDNEKEPPVTVRLTEVVRVVTPSVAETVMG